MEHTLPKLPCAQDALAPQISLETMQYHYGKHHQACVDNLNTLIKGTEYSGQPLEAIIKQAPAGASSTTRPRPGTMRSSGPGW
jgi:superoxide dismutase, Fe-Mn family